MGSCWLDPRMHLGEGGQNLKVQIDLLNAYK